MKKVISLFLICVCLLMAVGCKEQLSDPQLGPLHMIAGASYSDHPGMEVRALDLQYSEEEGKTELTVLWDNQTDYDVIYGAAYTVERQDGDQWVSCAMQEELYFIEIAYELKSGQSNEQTYNLTDTYNVFANGNYRFQAECFVHYGEDKAVKCVLTAEFTVGDIPVTDDATEPKTEIQWCARYIRTDGCQETVKFPSVAVIHSKQDLDDYYTTYRELFDLERNENVSSDSTIGFLDACDSYDEAYFKDNYLIFVLLEEGSGSVRHEVDTVKQIGEKKISVSIHRDVPEIGTADMAQWHIFLELNRDVEIETPNDVMLYLDGNLAFNGSVIQPPQPEAEFKTPPKAFLRTQEGELNLYPDGFDWTYPNPDGTVTSVIADQNGRPLAWEFTQTILVSKENAETIYAPIPGSTAYEPTNSLGYFVKLAWEMQPSSVSITCWPDTVWEDANTPEKSVITQDEAAFYAWQGGYIYEISAEWGKNSTGYKGSANYYVYITDDTHTHMTAVSPQTVADPITGYCGNTWTTIRVGEQKYGFWGSNSVALTDILVNLDYKPEKVCKCRPEFYVDTDFGSDYGVNLNSGYVRYEKGQADLTAEQVKQIEEILQWAQTTDTRLMIN